MGTLINSGLIIVGGLIGILFGKIISEKVREAVFSAVGVIVMLLGIDGVVESFIKDYGPDSTNKSLMLVVCLALGTIIGTIIDIDRLVCRFGDWLKKVTKSKGEATFTEGFLTASVTVCVGAMAVIGSIEDGINGNYSILLIKSIIDLITITFMTASMGRGCMFSAIPVLIFQGSITLLAGVVGPYLTEAATSDLSLVGSALIFCVGVSLMWKDMVKVANMLPAIVFAVAWAYIPIG